MSFNNSSAIIIIIVVAFAFYLVYSQNNQPKITPVHQISPFKQTGPTQCSSCQHFEKLKNQQQLVQSIQSIQSPTRAESRELRELRELRLQPQITNITVDPNADPYSDPIKKQDMYSMMDPLTYPQSRLSREILDKYNDYYEKHGSYPPFNQATQPIFDNPILNGILIKQVDENEPFNDNVPSSVPLFRVKSAKNTNRFFYYIIEQRYLSKLELKIPLDHIKINNLRYNNADFYGLPEIYDGDIIENISIYPGTKFRFTVYKTFHFP